MPGLGISCQGHSTTAQPGQGYFIPMVQKRKLRPAEGYMPRDSGYVAAGRTPRPLLACLAQKCTRERALHFPPGGRQLCHMSPLVRSSERKRPRHGAQFPPSGRRASASDGSSNTQLAVTRLSEPQGATGLTDRFHSSTAPGSEEASQKKLAAGLPNPQAREAKSRQLYFPPAAQAGLGAGSPASCLSLLVLTTVLPGTKCS